METITANLATQATGLPTAVKRTRHRLLRQIQQDSLVQRWMDKSTTPFWLALYSIDSLIENECDRATAFWYRLRAWCSWRGVPYPPTAVAGHRRIASHTPGTDDRSCLLVADAVGDEAAGASSGAGHPGARAMVAWPIFRS